MKTQKEIEQLAQQWFLNDNSLPYGEEFGFIQGYIQCQEDMAEENIEVNDKEIDKYISNYIDDLPSNWRSSLDMCLAIKNGMIEALSYPHKYSQTNNKQD